MRRKPAYLVMFGAAIAVTALYNARDVCATSAVGFTSTTLVKGKLSKINDLDKSLIPGTDEDGLRANGWESLQKPKGPSDLYVQKNVWEPGGSSGWHSHPGQSLVVVTEGTVTGYKGDDPECKPMVYTQGMAFADSGSGHVHLIRNEGTVVAQTIAVQLIPAGTARRIDAPDPGNCHF